MVSSPSYDPNGEADTSIDGLFINRCTLGTFTPGSVFKLVTLIAAVENLPDLTEQTFTCNQYLDLPGGTVVCTGCTAADDRAGARKFLQLRVWGACA